MRKECGRRSSSEVGIVDRVNDLGAMAWAVAPELCYGESFCLGIWIRNKNLKNLVEDKKVLDNFLCCGYI